jgi:DNA-binding phage protein
MTNINKLRGKIVEKGINVSELAKTLGIDKSTLYRKLKNNGEDISIKEANLIIKELNLTIEEVNAIFFSQFVACSATKVKMRN